MEKKFHYFIAFNYALGFGNTDFTLNKPIESIEDIRQIEKTIEEEDGLTKVSISNWRQF
jgi:hypothetical protein